MTTPSGGHGPSGVPEAGGLRGRWTGFGGGGVGERRWRWRPGAPGRRVFGRCRHWAAILAMAWIVNAGEEPAEPQLGLSVVWDEPAGSPSAFVLKGYRLVVAESGGHAWTNEIPRSICTNGIGRFRIDPLRVDRDYAFELTALYERKATPGELLASSPASTSFRTGAWVVGDTDPPVVKCDAAPVWAASKRVDLTGTVTDASSLWLGVEGPFALRALSYQGTGGVWRASVELSQPLPVSFVVWARDALGNATRVTNQVIAPPAAVVQAERPAFRPPPSSSGPRSRPSSLVPRAGEERRTPVPRP